jgi:hypothetical protein
MEKSQLSIKKLCIYLGMQLNFARGLFIVPGDKKAQLISLLHAALQSQRSLHVRDLARIKGKLVSMSWAFGIASKLFTRSMDKDISSAPTWSSNVALCTTTVDELRFWHDNFDKFNGMRPMFKTTADWFELHVDAAGRSKTAAGGWGAWCVVSGQRKEAHGRWSTSADSAMSSTAQELQASMSVRHPVFC